MKYNVYLIPNYNNYYNRKLKKLSTLNQYKALPNVTEKENINIEIRNGLEATITMNYTSLFTNSPDYAIIEDRDNGSFTRWFVLDVEKNRGLQYDINLKRDVVADYYDDLVLSDCYIEKGYHNNTNAKYNREQFQFNKIKQSQFGLYDELKCPWIVGYIAKQKTVDGELTPIPAGGITAPLNNLDTHAKYVVSDIASWSFYNKTFRNLDTYSITYHTPINLNNSSYYDDAVIVKNDGTKSYNVTAISQAEYNTEKANYVRYADVSATVQNFSSDLVLYNSRVANAYFSLSNYNKNVISNAIKNVISDDDSTIEDLLNNYNGEFIKDTGTNKTYKIYVDVIQTPTDVLSYTTSDAVYDAIRQPFAGNISGNIIHPSNPNTPDPSAMVVDYKYQLYKVSVREIDNANVSLLPNHIATVDAQYDMFAIPYGNIKVKDGTSIMTVNKDFALPAAQALATKLGSACYDVQIVPYCPVREYMQQNGSDWVIDISLLSIGQHYGEIKVLTTSTVFNFVFWCSRTTAKEIVLDYKIDVPDVKKDIDLNEYRLCAPNFSSQFEFSAGKNGGVKKFKYSFDYRPYNPYIRIWPEFNELYGQDFEDLRGLIYSGDMSVTILSDKWAEYQLQNKNYEKTFQREIESMELNKKWSMAESGYKAIAGTVAGVGAGALAGGTIGAAIGGTVAGAAGIVDQFKNSSLSNDAIDKAKDLFNYQLQNIQALPNTISKMTSINIDNLGVPIVEIYSCLDSEKEQYDELIKKYGQTIMRVGKVYDYIHPTNETFVQGTILRYESAFSNEESADNLLVKALSDELNKGIYINTGD